MFLFYFKKKNKQTDKKYPIMGDALTLHMLSSRGLD
jgi:hypothetical protein